MAIELSQRALADFAPRRRSASSITSSWYSVARWISSTTADGDDDVLGIGSRPDAGRDQREQRPESLAAGVHQVRRGLGDEAELADQLAFEQILDAGQAGGDPGRQVGVGELDAGEHGRGVHTDEPMSGRRRAPSGGEARNSHHHDNSGSGTVNQSSTGPGNSAEPSVTMTATAITIPVRMPGTTTYGASVPHRGTTSDAGPPQRRSPAIRATDDPAADGDGTGPGRRPGRRST